MLIGAYPYCQPFSFSWISFVDRFILDLKDITSDSRLQVCGRGDEGMSGSLMAILPWANFYRAAAVDSSGRELNRNRLIALMAAIVLAEVKYVWTF